MMGLFKTVRGTSRKTQKYSVLRESGNVFFTMFGAVALVGAVGAASMQVMKGPVRTMSEVTKRTVAENNMMASARLAIMAASNQADHGDCDLDGIVEPVPFITGGSCTSAPGGGGCLPSNLGAALTDPWDTTYGYCVWDHGSGAADSDGTCGASSNLIAGENLAGPTDEPTRPVLAVVSAGPDRIFQTTCDAGGDYTKPGSSDDLVLAYTYGEATTNAGGLWDLQSGDPDTAEISKDLEVKDTGGTTQFALDADTGALTAGGTGSFPSVSTDNISELTGGAGINMLHDVDMGAALDVTGNTTIGGTLGVTGLATMGDVDATTLDTTGNSTIGGTLGVTGNTSLSTLTSSGLASLNSLGVTTNATVGGTLGVTGLSTLGDVNANDIDSATLDTTGNATIGGTLGVTGATTFDSTVLLNGQTIFIPNASEGLGVLHESGASAAIRTGGLHVGGTYTGSAPTDGQIVTTDNTNISLLPGGTGNVILGALTNASNNRIINLAAPTNNEDAANKAYVDNAITTGVPAAEVDPQVDDIGTSGRWCNTDGSAIQCTSTAADIGAEIVTAGAGDNLGNHTATQNLNTANYGVVNVGYAEFTRVSGAALPRGGLPGVDTLTDLTCSNGQTVVWNNGAGAWQCAGLWMQSGSDVYYNAGNVGIGTTTPATNLHVGGSILAAAAGFPSLYTMNTDKVDGTFGRTWGWMNYSNGLHLNAYPSTGDSNIHPGAPLNAMFIQDATGNVGIGTITPTSRLHVNETNASQAAVYGYHSGANYGVYGHSQGSYGVVGTTDAATYGVMGQSNSASHGGVIGYTQNSTYYGILGYSNIYSLYGNGIIYTSYDTRSPIYYDANNTSFYLDPASTSILNDIRPSIIYDRDNTGYYVNPNSVSSMEDVRVGILYDRYNTGYYVQARGTTSLNAVYANAYYYHSDARLKENIQPFEDGTLNKLYDLEGVRFDWKESGKTDIGFIAQEVEKILPELVSQTDEGVMGVKYGNLVPLLVEAAKAQKVEIEELRARVENMTTPAAGPANNGMNQNILFGAFAFLLALIAAQGAGMIMLLRKKG